jgi:predicted N-acetyltransferase YhbS
MIHPLADHPEAVTILADWFFTEWNDFDGRTRSEIENQLRANLNLDSIPITFVALQGASVIGTVSLDVSDLPSHDYLSPWLASLYVLPEFQRQGLGRALISHVTAFARSQRLPNIYLWTASSTRLYERCGWRKLLATTYSDQPITIMKWSSDNELNGSGGWLDPSA